MIAGLPRPGRSVSRGTVGETDEGGKDNPRIGSAGRRATVGTEGEQRILAEDIEVGAGGAEAAGIGGAGRVLQIVALIGEGATYVAVEHSTVSFIIRNNGGADGEGCASPGEDAAAGIEGAIAVDGAGGELEGTILDGDSTAVVVGVRSRRVLVEGAVGDRGDAARIARVEGTAGAFGFIPQEAAASDRHRLAAVLVDRPAVVLGLLAMNSLLVTLTLPALIGDGPAGAVTRVIEGEQAAADGHGGTAVVGADSAALSLVAWFPRKVLVVIVTDWVPDHSGGVDVDRHRRCYSSRCSGRRCS